MLRLVSRLGLMTDTHCMRVDSCTCRLWRAGPVRRCPTSVAVVTSPPAADAAGSPAAGCMAGLGGRMATCSSLLQPIHCGAARRARCCRRRPSCCWCTSQSVTVYVGRCPRHACGVPLHPLVMAVRTCMTLTGRS
eukprot:11793108-Alexandrium_andersonii.AAC.1